jgi:integrase
VAKAQVRYRSPEQLRHTFASTLLSRNAPLLYVQRQGGWKSATVLLHAYARWVEEAEAHETARDDVAAESRGQSIVQRPRGQPGIDLSLV